MAHPAAGGRALGAFAQPAASGHPSIVDAVGLGWSLGGRVLPRRPGRAVEGEGTLARGGGSPAPRHPYPYPYPYPYAYAYPYPYPYPKR